MISIRYFIKLLQLLFLLLCFTHPASAQDSSKAVDASKNVDAPKNVEVDPAKLVVDAIDHWRGSTSFIEAQMTVHRPDWERKMKLLSLTSGTDKSLVRFVEPPKDAGSASLTLNNSMWNFAPKVNRVIKIPASMMSQSWMGSDFSYKDLARSDDIIEYYNHKLLRTEKQDAMIIYVVESIPKEAAPVVWGKEILFIREDFVILKHEFYDQDMKLLKQLDASGIGVMGGKVYPRVIRMTRLEEPDHWTEVEHLKVKFDLKIKDSVFTLSSLRNPRSISY